MNYYEHHLGDWAAATGHLTWDEDMAYTRLLRAYYHHEKAIPDGQQYRLAKATTPAQRKAVDQVLAEFFELRDGHHHQKRADAEIARFQDKQRKAKASAEARWQQTERNANASPNAMRTHSGGNAHQTPDTRHQTSSIKGGEFSTTVAPTPTDPPAPPGNADPPPQPSLAGRACLACRGANVHDVNPAHPDLLRLLAAGVTPEEIGATAAECAGKGKARFAYVLATVERRRAEAAAKPQAAASAPITAPSDEAAKTAALLREQSERAATKPPAALLALAGKAVERVG